MKSEKYNEPVYKRDGYCTLARNSKLKEPHTTKEECDLSTGICKADHFGVRKDQDREETATGGAKFNCTATVDGKTCGRSWRANCAWFKTPVEVDEFFGGDNRNAWYKLRTDALKG